MTYSYESFDLELTGNFNVSKSIILIQLKNGQMAKLKNWKIVLVDILAWLEIKGEEDEQQAIASAILA